MLESRFLCLAVSRRDGGNCIAGIDIDSGKWIRPVNAKSHGALADHETIVLDSETKKHRILTPLDILHLRLGRFVGDKVQPENWEMRPTADAKSYVVLRRLCARQDIDMLIACLNRNGPLLHSYDDRLKTDDPAIKRGLSRSLSIIQPEQLYWKVAPHPIYPNRLKVQADFRFDNDPYCLVVTDPVWEERCRHVISGRHPHSAIAGDAIGKVLLTISLAELPLHGYHFKLVAGVINLPV
jgi:hypothetical protein